MDQRIGLHKIYRLIGDQKIDDFLDKIQENILVGSLFQEKMCQIKSGNR